MFSKSISRIKYPTIIVLLVALTLTVAVAYAAPDDPEDILGDHPLQDHWGDPEASGYGTGLALRARSNGVAIRGKSVVGIGVKGVIQRTTGVSYAMYATNPSSSGYGLYATGGRYGVYGRSSAPGSDAVYGYNSATSGSSYGVRATSYSSSGRGVSAYNYANTGAAYGVLGVSYGGSGRAGYFLATADSGGDTIGVYARADGTAGKGVYGYAYNTASGTIGVLGQTRSANGWGVVGYQSGYSLADRGSYYYPGGMFAGKNGVLGVSNYSNGVGVVGNQKHTSGWAGAFKSVGHGVQIISGIGKTGLSVSGGTKSAAVQASDGERLLYTEESTEVWFTDYGFGALSDGEATIDIDPLFASTVNLSEPYHVFVQAYGPAELYVTNRSATGFDVILLSGDPNVEFSYRIVAKRLGFEGQRLELAPWNNADQSVEGPVAGIGFGLPEPDESFENDLVPEDELDKPIDPDVQPAAP